MRMIPATPYGTNSKAEKRVFDRLRTAFEDNNASPPLVAYHSLNLPRHERQRFGEIDFLLCGRDGIFVIEVKGGRVECRQGVWRTTDRHGQTHRLKNSPFRQAENGLHGLMKKLESAFPRYQLDTFTIGYGVVFPDCALEASGAEWDAETMADAQTFRDFQAWLATLFRYWQKKSFHKARPEASLIAAVQKYLRPEFEAVVPLHVLVDQSEERIARLTEDQMAMVDVVQANARVMCFGGAGTGKTFLALEVARRWTAEGLQVALACHSAWLKRYLETRFQMERLVVTTARAIGTAARRSLIDKFDGIIVDEGQDLLEMDILDTLDRFLKGGLSNGRWVFFHDVNNQANLFGNMDLDALSYLNSLGPVRIPLNTNCRNTLNILEKIKKDLGADMGVRGAGQGPDIREKTAKTAEEAAILLKEEITVLLHHGGLSPGEITLVSSRSYEDSVVSLLPAKIQNMICELDQYSLRSFPPRKISYVKIADFKGLENKAVIVLDLPKPEAEKDRVPFHYVAMSRPRDILSLIWCPAQR